MVWFKAGGNSGANVRPARHHGGVTSAAGQRIGWDAVPPHVRAEVERILGSPVVEARSQVGGFSPGTFELQWPPRSGRTIEVPEIDLLRWIPAEEAAALLTTAQRPLVLHLRSLLDEA